MIRTNIADVRRRLKSARSRLPGMIQEALSPDRYIDALRIVAEAGMNSVATTDQERAAIPILLNTISAAKTANGFEVSIHGVPFITTDPAEFLENTPRKEIVDWVERYKELTDRDYYRRTGSVMPSELIANRVLNAIRVDPAPFFRTDTPGRGALDPTGLVYITGLNLLPPERMQAMLQAALNLWVNYVRERAPHEIKFRLQEALR